MGSNSDFNEEYKETIQKLKKQFPEYGSILADIDENRPLASIAQPLLSSNIDSVHSILRNIRENRQEQQQVRIFYVSLKMKHLCFAIATSYVFSFMQCFQKLEIYWMNVSFLDNKNIWWFTNNDMFEKYLRENFGKYDKWALLFFYIVQSNF